MLTSSEILDRARAWLQEDVDPETRDELRALLDRADPHELHDRFADRLQFGTAGIRGILGAGPMRMNRVIVRRVSAGLGDYLIEHVAEARKRGVVIGYDGRKNSKIFAEDAARVLLGRGIKVWLSARMVPTPVVAFAVLRCQAAGGVMVTASHNPPDYNGYKVYWENGAQIVPPHDEGISAAIDRISRTSSLPLADLDEARRTGSLVEVGDALEEAYLEGVRGLSVTDDRRARADTCIAYTPLHGVGARFVEAALARAGFSNVHSEPSQRDPDGSFPTVEFPNPEEEGAMDRVLELAGEVGADVVFANDPDADRLAVAFPEDGAYRMLTGDQIGVLLADYLLDKSPADERRVVACSLVSSQMLGKMARAIGVDYLETLTGFKWIANTAMRDIDEHGGRFVMGYEEALGYTVGELVRDKDGVSATAVFAELVADLKARGETLADRLEALYRRHGFYLTKQQSLTLPGAEGLGRIQELMRRFRASPPRAIGGYAVVDRYDLLDAAEGQPPADVLGFYLEGDRRVIMRPSGTEPKLKSYYELCEPVAGDETFDAAVARARQRLEELARAHQGMLA
jgi:phosphomannomutase